MKHILVVLILHTLCLPGTSQVISLGGGLEYYIHDNPDAYENSFSSGYEMNIDLFETNQIEFGFLINYSKLKRKYFIDVAFEFESNNELRCRELIERNSHFENIIKLGPEFSYKLNKRSPIKLGIAPTISFNLKSKIEFRQFRNNLYLIKNGEKKLWLSIPSAQNGSKSFDSYKLIIPFTIFVEYKPPKSEQIRINLNFSTRAFKNEYINKTKSYSIGLKLLYAIYYSTGYHYSVI